MAKTQIPTANPTEAFGAYWDSRGKATAFCSCGWIETGWPNMLIAQQSVTAHRAKVHPIQESPNT